MTHTGLSFEYGKFRAQLVIPADSAHVIDDVEQRAWKCRPNGVMMVSFPVMTNGAVPSCPDDEDNHEGSIAGGHARTWARRLFT